MSPRAKVRPEGTGQWKIPKKPSGIETATFRLIAQRLNQLRHRVSQNVFAPNRNLLGDFWGGKNAKDIKSFQEKKKHFVNTIAVAQNIKQSVTLTFISSF